MQVAQPLRPALLDLSGYLTADLADRVPWAVRRDLRGLRLFLSLLDRPGHRGGVERGAGGGSVSGELGRLERTRRGRESHGERMQLRPLADLA